MITDNWNPDDYARHASFVPQLSTQLMRDLEPVAGERILDLGCGDGQLSQLLVQQGCSIVGVDNSPSFIRSAQASGLDARLVDAQEIEFECAFDAVFSNAAMHWMPHQSELARRVFRALKPGGRFVSEMGGAGNISRVRDAAAHALAEIGIDYKERDPWTFPGAEEQRARLEQAGFIVIKSALRDRPTSLPTDIKGWLVTFGRQLFAGLESTEQNNVIERIAELCHPHLCDLDGNWRVDYVRLNFRAEKPA
ncbi:MAG: methyltransferase domain-containing protein [Rhodobacteraceae bacterium]|nr:methyltransferase domain-containing protein [Paracoccaceae bacterium]